MEQAGGARGAADAFSSDDSLGFSSGITLSLLSKVFGHTTQAKCNSRNFPKTFWEKGNYFYQDC